MRNPYPGDNGKNRNEQEIVAKPTVGSNREIETKELRGGKDSHRAKIQNDIPTPEGSEAFSRGVSEANPRKPAPWNHKSRRDGSESGLMLFRDNLNIAVVPLGLFSLGIGSGGSLRSPPAKRFSSLRDEEGYFLFSLSIRP
ncbi:MAG: hypothetical protein JXA11_15545 [Phycisphaerae bacterium]|nr:hypothetical protein [Phycisphaerae bacterium]